MTNPIHNRHSDSIVLSPYNDGSVGSFQFHGDNFIEVDGTDFGMGSGAFTVEFWIYMERLAQNDYHQIIEFRDSGTGGTADEFSILVEGSSGTAGRLYAIMNSTAQHFFGSNHIIVDYTWNHVALVRSNTSSGGVQMYLNGNPGTSAETNSNTLAAPNTLYIGRYNQNANYNLYGNLSDIRIVKGHAVYTGAFTPPTTALTNISGTGYSTVLLAQPNGKNINTDTSAPEVRTFAAFNNTNANTNLTLTVNNTKSVSDGTSMGAVCGTVLRSSGKWYWEYLLLGGAGTVFGIANSVNLNSESAAGGLLYLSGGNKRTNPSTDQSYGDTYTTNDIIGVALDMDNGAVYFSKNGTFQGSPAGVPTSGASMTNAAFTGLSGGHTAFAQDGSTGTVGSFVVNFGQDATFDSNVTPSGGTNADNSFPDTEGNGSFRYAPPAGYNAITTMVPSRAPGLNKAALNPDEYFDILKYKGIEQAKRVRGLKFKPDFVWLKTLDYDQDHILFDSVRGIGKNIHTNTSDAEADNNNSLNAFNDDGFSLGTSGETQYPDKTYIAYCWRAGSEPVVNTDGNTPTIVSANREAGFSMLTWTGVGPGTAVNEVSLGHGLDRAPEVYFLSQRGESSAMLLYTTVYDGTNDWVAMNGTSALGVSSNKIPNSKVIYGGQAYWNTADVKHIIYAWHSVEGFSKFGCYVGNANTDGPFIYTGFKPKWLMIKRAVGTEQFQIVDIVQNESNPCDNRLFANSADDQNTDGANHRLDILSNGFKIRGAHALGNENGTPYIYMAFADTSVSFTNSR